MARLLRSKRIYEGRVIGLRVDTVAAHGREYDMEIVEHSGAVVVIAQPEPDEIVLVRQHRHAIGEDTWEVCAGGIDPGETPEDAAMRELREETGFRAHSVRRLWSAYSAPGLSRGQTASLVKQTRPYRRTTGASSRRLRPVIWRSRSRIDAGTCVIS